ncbi:hypothetical protein NW762_004109 [Fusarium torreyae]|uniref:RING-type domain-containing protein n=1 Tax=Fusarium torreyae TaxID=1237075 RepID=A0A9W8S5E4_9HYPO|nr:hypothetical protein NW762_004109 [Fusarium torreyae]
MDDDESLRLAIQLQREDLELWEARKGKRRADASSQDSDLILATCREELDAVESQLSDRALGRSIANAVEEDDATAREIQTVTAAEQEAERDRRYALKLSVNPDARLTLPEATQPDEQPTLDDETIERLKDLDVNSRGGDFVDPVLDYHHAYEAEEDLPHDESSTWAATRRHKNTARCVSCLDSFPERALSQEACSHQYCLQCLNNLAQASLRDESLFPLRCCGQTIPIDHRFFSPLLQRQLRAKKVEFETSDRTYSRRRVSFVKDRRTPVCALKTLRRRRSYALHRLKGGNDAALADGLLT